MANGEAARLRLERLRAWMAQENLDAFAVRSTSDIVWLTSFDGVFDDEQAHCVLVTAADAVLHTDSRYSEACAREAAGGPIAVDAAVKSHAAWCVERLGSLGSTARLGFDDLMSVREHGAFLAALEGAPGCELVATADAILTLRAQKDAFEVERLKAAQAITDAGFAHIVEFIRPGMTEREVQLELDNYMMAQGADGLAFPTIIATGAHGSSPHAQPGDAVIAAGDAIVMDFGARKGGYCSDMTRTVFVGEPSAELREAYAVLRRANEECAAMVRAGVVGADVHEHAQQVLAEGGFAGKMGHGLGHGVGIDIHEDPVLSPRNKEPLPAGAVVTVEPGIYIPGSFGMRLEDCGIVTEEGYEPFGTSTHEMVIVGA
ncbi:MAG: Xaa-Pro peptidase family protein [Coriobacteriia bacterium]|nr:Xaa-Pro peptidase family protein [Coriobacteriia bacterium]